VARTKKEKGKESRVDKTFSVAVVLWVFGFDPRQLGSFGVARLCAPDGHRHGCKIKTPAHIAIIKL
jgi:hypothetical protein